MRLLTRSFHIAPLSPTNMKVKQEGKPDYQMLTIVSHEDPSQGDMNLEKTPILLLFPARIIPQYGR